MDKELEVITIDEKDYLVIKEVTYKDDVYLYLSNKEDDEDNLIRKVDKNNKKIVIPLENDKEFELACSLLLKTKKAEN